jgi:hypothetical protein
MIYIVFDWYLEGATFYAIYDGPGRRQFGLFWIMLWINFPFISALIVMLVSNLLMMARFMQLRRHTT